MSAVTAFVDAMVAQPRATDSIKRDRWGRYLLPHPETGKEQSWTRATTLANTLADRYGLEQWAKRNVVLGIGSRSDLYARAASCTPEDRETLSSIVDEAEQAAASKAGANLGSALHRFTERIDAGEVVNVPEPWKSDVEAYRAAMVSNGITVAPGWLERILLIPEIDCAGTCDRLCNGMWSLPRIGDLKTAKDVVRYGMTEIALQLAIYAHASHWYDPVAGQLHDMPRVDQERALVMHLPVGQASCTLYEVDIASGWEAVRLATDVRRWRQRKDLASIVNLPAPVPEPTPDGLDPGRLGWIRDRVIRIVEAGGGETLADVWSTRSDVPTFRQGGPTTDEQIDVIAGMCEIAEMTHELPFGPSDPTVPGVTKATAKGKA